MLTNTFFYLNIYTWKYLKNTMYKIIYYYII
jgi:hypothetical protein